ncbi:MAG: hypothetical protein IPL35_11600 [Sphingobacteriales bacterium]|nr:hypothetical protein [Sphingobacteriales bacterium]
MSKKKPQEGKPQVHKELEGFEIKINEFGQVQMSVDPEQLNVFLNKNVDDKKLRERQDLIPDNPEEYEDFE